MNRDNVIRDALFNCTRRSGADTLYARGIVVGVVSTFMYAYQEDFEHAFQQTVQRCPNKTRIECFPEE